MGETTVVTAAALTEVRSEVAATTMEARLAAIRASLNESLALLASSAQLLGVKEREEQVATTAMPRFVQDRVREKPETKLLSSSPISAHPFMVVGALQEGADLTTSTPTRCSTVGSAVNGGGNHAVVVFPTSGTKHLAATNCTKARNTGMESACGTGMNTRANCSTDVLTTLPKGSTVGARALNSDLLRNTSFPRFAGIDPGLWRVQCLEYFNRFNISKSLWVIAARMHMDGKAKEWFDAYRLHQVVGDWSEFMDVVEANFDVGDSETYDTYEQQVGSCEKRLGQATRMVEPLPKDEVYNENYLKGSVWQGGGV